ncbi:MBL fold metallo-hydrolase [Candidatus Roizmanbacteria bacterium]|nr:MBL fold metallo-hydrolase [Candidatus Roizmanbacteria bacterium]
MKVKAAVIVIRPGYAVWENGRRRQRANGTITLIKSEKNIVVDTGLPQDKAHILKIIKKHHLRTSDIDYVICTHGDADHISNNNLFPRAKLIVGFDIYDRDMASFFQKNLKIDGNVMVTEMTGHDDRSIGVLVDTEKGLVAITGDLFEREGDWKKVSDWISFSKKPKDQIKNRAKVWELADFIVPGHGDIFKVDKSINILSFETKQFKNLIQKTANIYGDIEI